METNTGSVFSEQPQMHDRPGQDGESLYEFVAYSSRPQVIEYRNLIKDSISAYPATHREALEKRLKSKEDRQHRSAYFELFLHELLRGMCDRIEVEGKIENTSKQADFVLHYADGSAIEIEAMSIHDTRFTSDPNIEKVNQWIREIKSADFEIRFKRRFVNAKLSRTPSKRDIQKWVREGLGKYSWDEANELVQQSQFRCIPIAPLKLEEQQFEAVLYVVQEHEREEGSCLGVGLGGTGTFCNAAGRIRSKMREKIRDKKPSESPSPFILAVNIEDALMMTQPNQDELRVLYGLDHVTSLLVGDHSRPMEAQTVFSACGRPGVWSSVSNKSQYERCSAIWFFHRVGVSSAFGTRQALYLNHSVCHGPNMLWLHNFATAGIGMLEKIRERGLEAT